MGGNVKRVASKKNAENTNKVVGVAKNKGGKIILAR